MLKIIICNLFVGRDQGNEGEREVMSSDRLSGDSHIHTPGK